MLVPTALRPPGASTRWVPDNAALVSPRSQLTAFVQSKLSRASAVRELGEACTLRRRPPTTPPLLESAPSSTRSSPAARDQNPRAQSDGRPRLHPVASSPIGPSPEAVEACAEGPLLLQAGRQACRATIAIPSVYIKTPRPSQTLPVPPAFRVPALLDAVALTSRR